MNFNLDREEYKDLDKASLNLLKKMLAINP